MHGDGTQDEIKVCPHCSKAFQSNRRTQRFCKPAHQKAYWAEQRLNGIAATVHQSTLLKSGRVSLILRPHPHEQSTLKPGDTVRIVKEQ